MTRDWLVLDTENLKYNKSEVYILKIEPRKTAYRVWSWGRTRIVRLCGNNSHSAWGSGYSSYLLLQEVKRVAIEGNRDTKRVGGRTFSKPNKENSSVSRAFTEN